MTNKSVEYLLKGIEILDVKLNYPDNPNEKLKNYRFDMNLEHKLNIENNMVFVVPAISIFNEKNNTELGSIKISCAYEVKNFSNFVDKETNSMKFPDEFVTTINIVSISTARGVMYAQFRATFLQNAILPVINPSLLKKGNQKK
jgi:hypothetical protein